jgi:hypothetical protein
VRVPVGPEQSALDALAAAVAALDDRRAAALQAAGAVPAAATAVDAVDEAGATGQAALAADARRAARPAAAQAQSALAALPGRMAAYRASLGALRPVGAPLEPPQREALAQVAAAGEVEAAALAACADAGGRAWPAYVALSEVQATWLQRAQAGWYRTTAEAAGAYAVLRRPQVAQLEQARALLQSADAARRPATEAMRRELAEADAALDGLRAPTG